MRLAHLLIALALAGCATTPRAQVTNWRAVTTGDDFDRLQHWRDAFIEALTQARGAGHAADIEREGVLLNPDAALGGPIANGNYRCRVIKLGTKTGGMLSYIAYPAFRCRIDQRGQLQSFTKLTGSQRPVGLIYPVDQLRQVFLGTVVLGDETRAYQYGRDDDRDMAAWVERIGDNRWRLVMPYPRFESTLDVIELVPEQ